MHKSQPAGGRTAEKGAGLRDRFNRRIDYLRVSVTDRCNLSCVYCSADRQRSCFSAEQLLGTNEILRLVGIMAAHGLRKVRITGGEPLLRPDLEQLVEGLARLGVPDISLTSNGILLAERATELHRAGLQRVNISLDTLQAERYRGITRGGDISRVWRSIRAAQAVGLNPVKINVVPVRGLNDDEIVDFANLTREDDLHIRFIELMPTGGSRLDTGRRYVGSAEVLERLGGLGRLEKLPRPPHSTSRNYRLPGARGQIGLISPYDGHFCRTCNRLRLTAAGQLRPCLFSPKTVDVLTALRSGAGDEELEELLQWAVALKPPGNDLAGAGRCAIASMAQVGG